MMILQSRWQSSLLAVVAFLLIHSVVLAQKQGGKISVVGKGEISSPADQLVVVAHLTKKGKTIAEAAETFEESRTKLTDALNPMDFSGIEIVSLGKSVSEPNSNQMMGVIMPGMDAGDAEAPPASYAITESIQIKLPNKSNQLADIAEVMQQVENKVVLVGGKLGVQNSPYTVVGGNSMAFVEMTDKAKAELEAWRKAIEDARKKAEVLASLSGMTLGKIVAVKEGETTRDNLLTSIYGFNANANQKLGDVKVNRELIVEFLTTPAP